MDKRATASPLIYRPLQFGVPAALLVYMLLLLHITFGGVVASVVWWLVLALPISAVLAQFATQRVLWHQASYILCAVALSLTGWLVTNAMFAGVAPNAQILIAAILALSLILMAALGYRLSRRHVAIEGNRLETRTRARSSREEGAIVAPDRRWSIHHVSRPVAYLTIGAVTYGAVKLMSYDIRIAMVGLSALIFAGGGALLLGHTVYALILVREWESKHGAPLLVGHRG